MTLTVIDSNNLAAVLADAGAGDIDLEPRIDMTKATPEKGEVKEVKAEESEDSDDEEGEDGITQRQKRELSGKMLKAIGKKHRQVKEAEEYADAQYREKGAAERRTQALEREIETLRARVAPAPAPTGKPERQDYATESDFIESLTDWKTDQKFAQRDAERQVSDSRIRMQAQINRAEKLIPDFVELTSKATGDVPSAVSAYMQESDMLAELGYYFAKHPADLERLGRYSSTKQLVELGKIEATLTPFGESLQDGDPESGAQRAANGRFASPSLLDTTGLSPSKARRDAPVIKPLNSGEGQQSEPDVREGDVRQHIQQYQKDKKVNLQLRRRH